MLHIIELLGHINALLFKVLIPTIKAEGLTITEVMILMKVCKKGAFRAKDLAEGVGVPQSTFTGIVDRLVAKKYLTRVNDTEDRRSVLVQGTEELKVLMEHIISVCNEKLGHIFKNLPEDFVQQVIEDLQTMRQYLLQNEEHGNCDSN